MGRAGEEARVRCPLPLLRACASFERHDQSEASHEHLRLHPAALQTRQDLSGRRGHRTARNPFRAAFDEGQDVGKYINDHLLDIPGIERSLTTLTFKAF